MRIGAIAILLAVAVFPAQAGTLDVPNLLLTAHPDDGGSWRFALCDLDMWFDAIPSEESCVIWTGEPVAPRKQVDAGLGGSCCDLSIRVTGALAPEYGGSLVTYTMVVHNRGPNAAISIDAYNTLPEDMSPLGWSAGCKRFSTATPAVVHCLIGNLGVSGTQTFSILATVPNEPATVTDRATVIAAGLDPNTNNNSSFVTMDLHPPAARRRAVRR